MSEIKEIKTINILDRDLYFLTSTPTEIVINNDSEDHYKEGVAIYDYHLERKKKILFPGEKVGIYSSFKKFSDDEILFYCPDDECLVYVNLNNSESLAIPLPDYLEKNNFIASLLVGTR